MVTTSGDWSNPRPNLLDIPAQFSSNLLGHFREHLAKCSEGMAKGKNYSETAGVSGQDERLKWGFGSTSKRNFADSHESELMNIFGQAATRLPFARISVAAPNVRANVDATEVEKQFQASSEDWAGQSGNAENVLGHHLIETADKTRREFRFRGMGDDSVLQTIHLKDTRQPLERAVDSFYSRFFPLGYPNSVSEGYLVYSQYRAVQHFASAVLSVLSTQSLLFAAGLRPTPAQATIVSWVLKDGMQHIGKLICSSMGARMDSEPKRWRIFADVMYDVGAGLEVISPLCPQHFLTVAGLANMAKGMALVSARATRLPVYSSFAREGNLSDLYAKGEAISTLSNVFGLGVGIQLASTVCATIQGKLLIAPVLSAIHLYSVAQEMRAAPINTLNGQRTAMLVADFLKTGEVSKPVDLRYRERLILPVGLQQESGNVRVGASLLKTVSKPSVLSELKKSFGNERFLLNFSDQRTDLVLHQSATGEDAVRGWLLAAYACQLAHKTDQRSDGHGDDSHGFGLKKAAALRDAYEKTEQSLPALLEGLRENGWHTHLFLEGSGYRAVW
ncbi:hypothetical protein MPTK1_2g09220 [Marchantia polymorpha subsp. ruderalis]|uniref:DUF647 domain-containing protein n=2 Tax=Marchantia polymorpha TaxID=3197 RepID=A0A176VFG0_MARPO|nr:hypothetical protein AXG93_625s1260 [Marchantia polymorpha subsp. ruderalis]PTQ45426.1 hypothetical protein MARPO_0015s0205 [Marchantia polymorpha]BBN01660.1 hypothetical protein Mp_2g09220 [Marchantia polymorpha subsp. ruderalis]|eukprot:PTQ45426.1 hypothetical protein MARPO_0015s0205 [Marchantia polymorpha]